MAQGGYIAPDGRPPQAPGVGKDSKRHDLEAPATPGVRNSDMRQGDRQMLEAGQKVAPRPKKSAPRNSKPRSGSQQGGSMEVPDPIEFAAGKIGGQIPTADATNVPSVDPKPWLPLLQRFVTAPGGNPAIAAAYVDAISKLQRQPISGSGGLVSLNEADDILMGGS